MLLIQIMAGIILAGLLGKLQFWIRGRFARRKPSIDESRHQTDPMIVSFRMDDSMYASLNFAHLASCEIAELKGLPIPSFGDFCSSEASKYFYLSHSEIAEGWTALMVRERKMAGILTSVPHDCLDNPFYSEDEDGQ